MMHIIFYLHAVFGYYGYENNDVINVLKNADKYYNKHLIVVLLLLFVFLHLVIVLKLRKKPYFGRIANANIAGVFFFSTFMASKVESEIFSASASGLQHIPVDLFVYIEYSTRTIYGLALSVILFMVIVNYLVLMRTNKS